MNVLIWGDTETSPALRHEVPLAIGDPFLYLESDGRRAVVTNALEDARIARVAPDLERLLIDSLGRDELLAAGWPRQEIELEVSVRGAERMGIKQAVVPPEFPLALADRLRARGVELTPDDGPFTERRRHKTAAEMAGIRRAAHAALAAMGEAAGMLRAAEIRDGHLWLDGEQLTSETVRGRMREVCNRAGAAAAPDIIVKPEGPHASIGHDPGSGPLPASTPIVVDLWPRDEASDCWADMTRTFVRGEISDAIAELYALVLSAHERSCAAVRPGIPGVEVYGIACDVFEAAGHPTARTKRPGETLREGFYHGLGHGVGLAVHEAPALGRTGTEPLIAGDVIAVEPGTVVASLGGARVEDLLVVTEQGSESLTGSFPYDLAPSSHTTRREQSMTHNITIRRGKSAPAKVTGARITGAHAVGARLLGPTAMGPLAIAVCAVGAVAIGRLAIADAVIRRLRAQEIEIGSLKVRELEVAGQRWPAPGA